MKKNKFSTPSIIAVCIMLIFSGCKEMDAKPPEVPVKNELKISELKVYMSQLLMDPDTSKIKYDPNTTMFSVPRQKPISLDEISELYKKAPINNYRNGLPVKH